jgi:hypothetical protein
VNKYVMPKAMKARVLGAARKMKAPTRQAVTLDAVLVLVTGAAVAINVFLAAGGFVAGPRPTALVVSTALGRGTIALASTWASLARGGSMLGRSLTWLVMTAILTPLAIAGWMLLAASALLPNDASSEWHCLAIATLAGAGPLAAFVVVRRRTDLAHPIATGAALGVAAGAWADFLMVLHCPAPELAHRLLCHAVPSAFLAATGAALGALVVRPEAEDDRTPARPSVVPMSESRVSSDMD